MIKKTIDTVLNVRPIFVGIQHLYFYEGPCRFGEGDELMPEYDAMMNQEMNAAYVNEVVQHETEGVNVYLTIDREQEGWDGHVGFVPAYLKELGFDTNKTALLCGPPIMIKFCLASLIEMGFSKEQVYTTLELRMKCGIGKCGRCNIGSKYVCKDGPVFRCDEIDELPNEY